MCHACHACYACYASAMRAMRVPCACHARAMRVQDNLDDVCGVPAISALKMPDYIVMSNLTIARYAHAPVGPPRHMPACLHLAAAAHACQSDCGGTCLPACTRCAHAHAQLTCTAHMHSSNAQLTMCRFPVSPQLLRRGADHAHRAHTARADRAHVLVLFHAAAARQPVHKAARLVAAQPGKPGLLGRTWHLAGVLGCSTLRSP